MPIFIDPRDDQENAHFFLTFHLLWCFFKYPIMKTKRDAVIKKIRTTVQIIFFKILIPDSRKKAILFEMYDLINLKRDNRSYSSRLSVKSATEPKIANNFVENEARYALLGILASELFLY